MGKAVVLISVLGSKMYSCHQIRQTVRNAVLCLSDVFRLFNLYKYQRLAILTSLLSSLCSLAPPIHKTDPLRQHIHLARFEPMVMDGRATSLPVLTHDYPSSSPITASAWIYLYSPSPLLTSQGQEETSSSNHPLPLSEASILSFARPFKRSLQLPPSSLQPGQERYVLYMDVCIYYLIIHPFHSHIHPITIQQHHYPAYHDIISSIYTCLYWRRAREAFLLWISS